MELFDTKVAKTVARPPAIPDPDVVIAGISLMSAKLQSPSLTFSDLAQVHNDCLTTCRLAPQHSDPALQLFLIYSKAFSIFPHLITDRDKIVAGHVLQKLLIEHLTPIPNAVELVVDFLRKYGSVLDPDMCLDIIAKAKTWGEVKHSTSAPQTKLSLLELEASALGDKLRGLREIKAKPADVIQRLSELSNTIGEGADFRFNKAAFLLARDGLLYSLGVDRETHAKKLVEILNYTSDKKAKAYTVNLLVASGFEALLGQDQAAHIQQLTEVAPAVREFIFEALRAGHYLEFSLTYNHNELVLKDLLLVTKQAKPAVITFDSASFQNGRVGLGRYHQVIDFTQPSFSAEQAKMVYWTYRKDTTNSIIEIQNYKIKGFRLVLQELEKLSRQPDLPLHLQPINLRTLVSCGRVAGYIGKHLIKHLGSPPYKAFDSIPDADIYTDLTLRADALAWITFPRFYHPENATQLGAPLPYEFLIRHVGPQIEVRFARNFALPIADSGTPDSGLLAKVESIFDLPVTISNLAKTLDEEERRAR